MLICILLFRASNKISKRGAERSHHCHRKDNSKSVFSNVKQQKEVKEALLDFKVGNKFEVSKLNFAEDVAIDTTEKKWKRYQH